MSDVNKQVNLLVTQLLRNKSTLGDQTRIHGETTLSPYLPFKEIQLYSFTLAQHSVSTFLSVVN